MATINRDFFIAQFREEVSDHIQRITQRLFQLEEQPGNHAQLIEEIFRIAHTLKGSSRMMGYADISGLAHKMEDLLVEIRDRHLELHPAAIDLLFYCLDTINYLVEGIAKHVKRTTDLEEFTKLFQDVIAGKQFEIPHFQTQRLKPTAEIVKTLSQQAARSAITTEPLEEVEEQQYIRIHTGNLDAILNLVGELIINQYRYEGQRTGYQEVVQELREHQDQLAELQRTIQNENGTSLRTRLAELSDNLERSNTEALRKTKTLLKKTRTDAQQMRLAINNLHEQVIDIRMVPASRIFHLFPRLARMTARRLGKMVELNLLGEDTKIDSRIIEEMRDPLIHLVQNAIHHGIENPDKRQGIGKNPTGIVTISAHQEGNRIIMSVRDDGQGIHLERIRDRAVQEGMVSHKQMRAISEQELLEMLFRPGFSTSDIVDDIAGRGFGLDIVRERIDRVQGEIEVHSHRGQGTEFVLKLPLTLTIMNALLVRVADQVFAIPTVAVEKTFDITPDEIDSLGNMPVVVFDHSLLPIVELHQILRMSPYTPQLPFQSFQFCKNMDRKTVIVLQAKDRRIGFLVDDLIVERKIVTKHLGPCLKRVRNVAGATTIHGEVVIILFVRDLVRSADMLLEAGRMNMPPSSEYRPLQDGRHRSGNIVPRVLLVDDSLNTREVERGILEHAGYEVIIAENGIQGLGIARRTPVDLIITDVEMPEMDGLALTKAIKQDNALQNIPVLIVSTKGTPEDRRQGFEAGALAYIVKGEFNEKTLLKYVDDCLK